MKNIWFTSDLHLSHTNIIKFCNRPFSDAYEMNETIIENHNKLVRPGDIVYNLGDLLWNMSYDKASYLVSRFNGLIHIIKGNHDKEKVLKRLKEEKLIESYQDTLFATINDQFIHMYHYPLRSWNRAFHGSWSLHGHVHTPHNRCEHHNSIDVGVDGWGYKPVHFDEVMEAIKLGPKQS